MIAALEQALNVAMLVMSIGGIGFALGVFTERRRQTADTTPRRRPLER